MFPDSGAVLGVDGGSTKTHVALASRDGRLLSFIEGPGTNHEGIGYPRCASILRDLFTRACRSAGAGAGAIRYACFGMCGADLPEDFREIERRLVRPLGIRCPVRVHNDAFLPIFNDGWRDRGVGVTCGGWHKWVGVNGGRWFMQEGRMNNGIRGHAVDAIYRAYEGFERRSRFAVALSRWLGFSGVDDFMERWHYGGGKRRHVRPVGRKTGERMLRIPEFLGERARQGDRTALGVIDRYGRFSAESVGAVARRLGLSGRRFEVVLSGSINAGLRPLQRSVARHLRTMEPGARAFPARWKPVRGALVYSAHMAWGGLPAGSLSGTVLAYGTAR